MFLGTSPSSADALFQIRRSRYARAFLASDRFAEFWLQDLRVHAALALIMARASAAAVGPAALTRRGVSDLAGLSMSAVHGILADACARGDFRRDADAGDRRRVLLVPSPTTAEAYARLLGDFLLAAAGGAPQETVAEAIALEPPMIALYARFVCALVAARRPGGRLWLQPASLALLADLLATGRRGARIEALRAAAARRRLPRHAVEDDLALAGMAGLVETGPEGRLRLTAEGRGCMLDHLEIWRSWAAEARLALAALAAPISIRAA